MSISPSFVRDLTSKYIPKCQSSFWAPQRRSLLPAPTQQIPSSASECLRIPVDSLEVWTDCQHSPCLHLHRYLRILPPPHVQSCQPRRAIEWVEVLGCPTQDLSRLWRWRLSFRSRCRLVVKIRLATQYREPKWMIELLCLQSEEQSVRVLNSSCYVVFWLARP